MNVIYNACDNFIKKTKVYGKDKNGKYFISSSIDKDIEIGMHITAKGKIITAYPVFK